LLLISLRGFWNLEWNFCPQRTQKVKTDEIILVQIEQCKFVVPVGLQNVTPSFVNTTAKAEILRTIREE